MGQKRRQPGYDAAGNVTQNGSVTYTYDAENRITATSGYSYVYDGDGERVIKCSGTYPTCATGTLYWRGNAPDALTELTFAGAASEEYTFFGGKRVARRDGTSVTVHYYFADHLGSTDLITGKDGGINKTSAYYPYGREITVNGSTYANNYKFTGKERDAESGLDMFGARYYGSSMGRFMTPDWSSVATAVPYADFGNPQSLNLYSYTKNNPTTLRDPNGHCDVDGEHHGWVWCAAHAIGITETQERAGRSSQSESFRNAGFTDQRPTREPLGKDGHQSTVNRRTKPAGSLSRFERLD